MADDERNDAEPRQDDSEAKPPEEPTTPPDDVAGPQGDPLAGQAAEGAEQPAEPEPAEGSAPEESAAEEPPTEPDPEPEPAEERKRDVIPGADLEPLAPETEDRPLSAEEQARREAEAEEQARREAKAAAAEADEPAASRAPAEVKGDSRFLATGKRKHSIARVTLRSGGGDFRVNGRPLEEFFPRPLHRTMARQPLVTTGYDGSLDISVRVNGGGISGQAGAVRHGVARALTEVDSELRGELKRRGYLTRDARSKERRKAGLKKARKRPQFSKR